MDIEMLPFDCFYHILQFLTIDDRIQARPAFQMFEKSFNQICHVANTKALGIDLLEVDSLLDNSTKKICSRFNLYERWACSNSMHVPQERFSTNKILIKNCDKCGDLFILCILRHCFMIESLDIRGVILTVPLVNGIIKYCSKICCLKLNFSSFENNEAFELFVNQLVPKLTHLSCDNLFINTPDGFTKFFSKAINLNQIEMVLFPKENLKPRDLVSIKSDKLEFLSLRFYRTKTNQLNSDPSQYISSLNEGKGKNISYFKVKSNYSYLLNYYLFLETKRLNYLKAINLNFMNFYQPSLDFKIKNCWPHLESLTLDLFCLRGSNQLLSMYLDGSFKSNLKSLRIIDCHLKKKTLINLSMLCPNLSILQLVDVTFKDVGKAFDCFRLLKNLKNLHIEYTLNDSTHNHDSLSQLQHCFHFPIEISPKIIDFIRYHSSIEELNFFEWPGMKKNDLRDLIEVAKQNCVQLNIKEY